jgi:hypothetical protein
MQGSSQDMPVSPPEMAILVKAVVRKELAAASRTSAESASDMPPRR